MEAAGAADAVITFGENLDLLEPLLEILETQAPAYLMDHKGKTDLLVKPGLLAAFVYCRTGHALLPQLVMLSEQLLDEPRGASQSIMVRSLLGHTELALRDAHAALALVKENSALHTQGTFADDTGLSGCSECSSGKGASGPGGHDHQSCQ